MQGIRNMAYVEDPELLSSNLCIVGPFVRHQFTNFNNKNTSLLSSVQFQHCSPNFTPLEGRNFLLIPAYAYPWPLCSCANIAV